MQPGIYTFTNVLSSSAMDLSGGDHKSIIGFPAHGRDNQQWELTPLGHGFSIRSLSSGQYLTIEAGIYNGVPIVASPFPVSWVVQVDVHDKETVHIGWPNSHYIIELEAGNSTPGTKVQLWQKYPRERHRTWRFVRCGETCERRTSDDIIVTEDSNDDLGDMIITTTMTTTTVTKVVRIRTV